MPTRAPDADLLTLFPIVAGLLLLIGALGALLAPSRFGVRLGDNFEITNSWFTLKTSMLAVLFILGFLLVASGIIYRFYASNPDLPGKLATLTAQNQQLQQALEKAKLFSVQAYFKLPRSVDATKLDIGNLRCKYRVVGRFPSGSLGSDWVTVSAGEGKSTEDVSCLVQDISRSDVIDEVQIVLLQSNSPRPRVLGFFKNITLLEPTFDLESAQH